MPAILDHPLTIDSLFYPLSEFYRELQLPLPEIRQVAPDELPEPYRRLLVHGCDMTPTLETAHGGTIGLRVVMCAIHENVANRVVALVLQDGGTVGMGAIRIFLEHLPAAARKSVVDRREPFGTILRNNSVTHQSRPVAYFQVRADSMIGDALATQNSPVVYGRRNTIWNSSGNALAEVVEILPPSSKERR
jgi:hypothetical protein